MTVSRRISKTVFFIIMVTFALVMLYPLLWMISSSFKPEEIIFTDKRLWIAEFTWDNYILGWEGIGGVPFITFYKNTFLIVALTVTANLLACSMTAYAFARLPFRGKKIFFTLMIFTILLPMHASMIPRYIMFNRLRWINSIKPLVVPSFFAVQSFFIFLILQFIRAIPYELDQAATVDGCNPITIYWRIIVPLAMPALTTTAIFTFIWTYNNFFQQLLYLNEPSKLTISLALRQFTESTDLQTFGQLFAMSLLSLVPIFAFFIGGQKYIIEGISTTGIK